MKGCNRENHIIRQSAQYFTPEYPLRRGEFNFHPVTLCVSPSCFMSGTFWLTEEQFCKIKPLFPNKPRGVARSDDRKVLSGIIFCLQRGYCWSDVPTEYGAAKTLYNRYKRWSEAGVFERIF